MSHKPRTILDWQSDPRFREYVRLFDHREFFEAHEVLEGLWMELNGPDRDFLQGLIQLSVCLEHHARENPRGAFKVLWSAEERLASYGAVHAGIPIEDLERRIEAYLSGRSDEPPRFPRAGGGKTRAGEPES